MQRFQVQVDIDMYDRNWVALSWNALHVAPDTISLQPIHLKPHSPNLVVVLDCR